MEGLRISCARSTYDVVVVREDFHYHKRSSPDAIFESKFHRLVVCFRIENVAVVVDFESCVDVAFLS